MLRVIKVGFKDGFAQPWEFNYGMTYSSNVRQWVYDISTLIGQFTRRTTATKGKK